MELAQTLDLATAPTRLRAQEPQLPRRDIADPQERRAIRKPGRIVGRRDLGLSHERSFAAESAGCPLCALDSLAPTKRARSEPDRASKNRLLVRSMSAGSRGRPRPYLWLSVGRSANGEADGAPAPVPVRWRSTDVPCAQGRKGWAPVVRALFAAEGPDPGAGFPVSAQPIAEFEAFVPSTPDPRPGASDASRCFSDSQRPSVCSRRSAHAQRLRDVADKGRRSSRDRTERRPRGRPRCDAPGSRRRTARRHPRAGSGPDPLLVPASVSSASVRCAGSGDTGLGCVRVLGWRGSGGSGRRLRCGSSGDLSSTASGGCRLDRHRARRSAPGARPSIGGAWAQAVGLGTQSCGSSPDACCAFGR